MMSVADYFSSMDYGSAPEADQDARAWLDTHHEGFGHFINGTWQKPHSQTYFATHEPRNGKVLATIAQGSAEDIDKAVKAARGALSAWQKLGGHGRARHLYALARMVQRHSRLFAVLETLDNGKPLRESRDIDVPLVARHFYHHAGWAQIQDNVFRDYAPIGVVGQIIPWNFPLLMLAWKIAPALALGNTVVLKPAEWTPLTALLFADLAKKAGLPDGALNIVTGDGSTGALLANHNGIDKIAFTGSTEVGKSLRETTAGSGKALTLELGGKSPFIVFDDADLDSAVEGVVDSIWFNQGQVCCAGSRLLMQEAIAERFLAKLKQKMASLRLGDPLDKTMDMGAVIGPAHLETIRHHVEQAVSDGAHVHQASLTMPSRGSYYPPTLLEGLKPDAKAVQEEIFGPVLTSMTFRTPDEAVMLANHTRYGLAASVWSESINLALDIAPQLKAGVVWINSTNLFDASAGFGGYRESGFGREGGQEGAYAYLVPKAWRARKPRTAPDPLPHAMEQSNGFDVPAIDRTAKLFIGGKQARPDGNTSRPLLSPKGTVIGEVGVGNRKDIRNAVRAARGAEAWGKASAHNRAQILYYLAENLSARAAEFSTRLSAMTGASAANAKKEVEASIRRLFTYAAWADKFEGVVHRPPMRGVALAMKEAVGVVGVLCPDEAPLLALISLVAPLLAMGNTVVAVPSERYPLAATDLYQVLETSDLPAGVLNIVTGSALSLGQTLAEHDEVDAVWSFGSAELSALVERRSIGNLKRTLVDHGLQTNWYASAEAEGELFLHHAVEIKNIWIPYGE
jgi:aldehyde dehydrogenase (NAD+)